MDDFNDEVLLEMERLSDDGEYVLQEVEDQVVAVDGVKLGNKGIPVVEWVESDGKPNSLYFVDGVRRIDYVMVYEDEDKKIPDKKNLPEKKKRRREAYESNLIKCGLQLEATRSVLDDKIIFVKVHAPWEVLCTYAEAMHIKMPLQPDDLKPKSSNFSCLTKLFSADESIIKPEQEFFTAPFEKDRLSDFHILDKDLFFTPSTRSRIIHYILCSVEYAVSRDNVKKVGIEKLIESGVYKAAYPLHDTRFNYISEDLSCPNERYLLYREWAHPRSFYKLQPLDLIRKYFGEKVGIYFAWLGYYTKMLLLAAVAGICCFGYGYSIRNTSTWSLETCDADIGGNIIMCPQCDKECTYWMLNITCESSKKLCIFDNFGTLVFAVFMAIWVTLFLEFWKRRQAELEYEWDTTEFLDHEEPVRPEYEARCIRSVKNPITQEVEHVPYTACGKCLRMSLCSTAVLFAICLIIVSVVGIIVYRLSVFVAFSSTLPTVKNIKPLENYLTPQMATTITASLINFIIIMILNMLYERLAIKITDFELPRTQSDYENSLTLKMFLFQFVNFYSSCFYIAFFKGKVVGYPGDPVYWLGKYRNEECDPGGCLLELTTQLMIIMGGKAIWNNIQEVLLPWIKNLIARYCVGIKSEHVIPRWEQDYQLQMLGKLGLFYEYLEMVIQFGFVTLFVASFPLAPVLAFFNNLIEIRVDAWKLTTQYRRPVPAKAQDIGAWQPILQGVAFLAVVTNAMIIAFTSDMIPRLVYYWSFSTPPYGNSPNHTMAGYINSSLSVFQISDFKNSSKPKITPEWFNDSIHTTCRYRDYRNPPGHPQQYEFSIFYWHVIAAKLAFVIVIEHVVYSVKFILAYIIPDVSSETREKVKREKYLTQSLRETRLKIVKKRIGSIADKLIKGQTGDFRSKIE
ncbi:anoctamin-6 [Protopterus annectens]|uniref:anoctamin-6 n=1 Tax=Protopterus annectens TaxID=7888 RepID=UPI001CFC0E13|nr:anoctamin-6 [Protopterus annectens]